MRFNLRSKALQDLSFGQKSSVPVSSSLAVELSAFQHVQYLIARDAPKLNQSFSLKDLLLKGGIVLVAVPFWNGCVP